MATFLSIGTGPGIGLATAERFACEGFHVVLSARNRNNVTKLAPELARIGHKAEVRTVDAGNPATVAALIAEVESEFGGVDVLHFNAASIRKATLEEQPRDTIISDLAVNIGGAIAAAQAVAPRMVARGSGSILLTGGGYALRADPEHLSLSIGKAGIRALAQGMFDSFKARGVHIASVTVTRSVDSPADAAAVAEHFWCLHSQPLDCWEVESIYAPAS
jgi:NADP-dependent 3-hydroxy acid dehydrogenase YdfG